MDKLKYPLVHMMIVVFTDVVTDHNSGNIGSGYKLNTVKLIRIIL